MKDKKSRLNFVLFVFPPLRIILGLCLAMGISFSPSSSYSNDLFSWIDDPLLSRPDLIDEGSILPGDRSPIDYSRGCQPLSYPRDEPLHGLRLSLNESLSLDRAIDYALCNNPQIRATWASIKVQADQVGEARAAYLPTLNGSWGRLRNQTNYPEQTLSSSLVKGNQYYLSGTWRLFDFGARTANRESANKLLLSAIASHNSTLQKLLSKVIEQYFDSLTKQAINRAKSRMADLNQSLYESALRREKKGLDSASEALQAEAALAKSRLDEKRSFGDYQKAKASLLYLMGLSLDSEIYFPEKIDVYSPQIEEELQAWLEVAQSNHPAILAAKAQWESDKAKIDVYRSQAYPTLDFIQSFSQNGYPNQSLPSRKEWQTVVGFQLNIPLFDGFAQSYKIRGAKSKAEQSLAELENTEQQILLDVLNAYSDATSSLANLDNAHHLLEVAHKALISSENRYHKGATPISEVLRSQAALADAEQEDIRAMSEWRSARLRLLANSGQLGRDKITRQD